MVTRIPEKGKTSLDYFRYFIDEEVVKIFVENTNLYAEKHNREGNCTENEILTFTAILLLSGYIKVPRKHMYWQSNLESHNTLVADAMSRNHFQFIMSNLHVCDNDKLSPTDKFAKIRPLLDMLNKRFMDFSPHEQNHSVDESMVPYFGRHSAIYKRQTYPFWNEILVRGYVKWLLIVVGSISRRTTGTNNYQDKGLGYVVVMTYVDQLPPQIPFRIYFDNLFTSFNLLNDLKERNIEAIGTIRVNRIDTSCTLSNIDVMKKTERGSYEYEC
ncbi:PREDICTED: piggyBac transposable element-derived protein 3-like [Rhagoletis zephyria]|uniref:piggyBac transposable element-derived protein 3-like n=1 Tax=Rhagoletis zephyria TaxID=28612 RepID=UPI00081145B7|nr:PREDICTED: piggyBac transposable element-derived protein 3-like [Rhagoletis zephyria]